MNQLVPPSLASRHPTPKAEHSSTPIDWFDSLTPEEISSPEELRTDANLANRSSTSLALTANISASAQGAWNHRLSEEQRSTHAVKSFTSRISRGGQMKVLLGYQRLIDELCLKLEDRQGLNQSVII